MLNGKDNKQQAHYLADLLVNNPEYFPIELIKVIQARLMYEVVNRLKMAMYDHLAKLEKALDIKENDND